MKRTEPTSAAALPSQQCFLDMPSSHPRVEPRCSDRHPHHPSEFQDLGKIHSDQLLETEPIASADTMTNRSERFG